MFKLFVYKFFILQVARNFNFEKQIVNFTILLSISKLLSESQFKGLAEVKIKQARLSADVSNGQALSSFVDWFTFSKFLLHSSSTVVINNCLVVVYRLLRIFCHNLVNVVIFSNVLFNSFVYFMLVIAHLFNYIGRECSFLLLSTPKFCNLFSFLHSLINEDRIYFLFFIARKIQ